MSAVSDIRIRWLLDVVDKGGPAKVLRDDRAIRASLTQTDAQYKRTATTAASSSSRMATAASRAATGAERETRARVAASDEVNRYAASQREALTIATRVASAADRNAAAYAREGRASRAAAAEASRASRVRSAVGRGASTVIGGAAAVGSTVRNAAATAGVGVGLAGLAGIGVAIKETVGFDRALRNVNSIAQLSEKHLQGVGTAIRTLAGKTAQAPRTLAEGMYDLVSSGFKARDALSIVGVAARAATAGLTTTDVSTKAVAAVLNAYHLSATKAAAVSDTLFQTVNLGVVTFGELAEHIGTVLPFANTLGINLRQVGAAISTMTKQGISGELSITFLKNAMVAFLKPAAGMKEAIKKTGAASAEALIHHRGFEGALNAVIHTTDGTKSAIARLFPNIRAQTAAFALTGTNARTAASDLRSFQNDAGATGKALSQQAQSVSYQWNKVKATFSATAIELGSKFIPAANKALTVVRELLNPSGKSGTHQFVSGLKAGIAGGPTPGPKSTVALHPLVHALPSAGRAGPFAQAEPFAAQTRTKIAESSGLASVGQKIGSALRTIGTESLKYGKQLLDAFKPAEPFFLNVLLPAIEGIGTGVVLAFTLAIPVVKIFATALGEIGNVVGPLSPLIKLLGLALGVYAAGPVLGLLGTIPKLGLVFRLMQAPITIATTGLKLFGKGLLALPGALGTVGRVLTTTGGLFGKLPGKIGATAGSVFNATSRLATAAGRGLKNLPAKLAVNAYAAGQGMANALSSASSKVAGGMRVLVSAAARVAGGLANKVTGALSAAIGATKWKELYNTLWQKGTYLGSAIQAGVVLGLAALAVMVGKKIKEAATGWKVTVDATPPFIHIKRTNRTTSGIETESRRKGGVIGMANGGMVDAFVSPGEQVVYGEQSWTVPGTRTAADSVYAQLPVGAAVLTGDGQRRMGAGASLGEALATQAPHFASGGTVVRGRVSTFGPPNEGAAKTASGVSDSTAGVAIRPGATYQSGEATLGRIWNISIGGHSASLKQIDVGPNQSTGRRIDVTGAGARALKIDPRGFPTDSTGTATLLGSGAKPGTSVTLPVRLGASRTRAGLLADALSQGIEAGAAGLTREEIAAGNRGARGARVNPAIAAITEGLGSVTQKVATKGGHAPVGGTLTTPTASWNPNHVRIASWIDPYLSFGATHGWPGSVTSGFRSRAEQTRIYDSGVRPAAVPGTSKHEGFLFPDGAVDVTSASTLSSVLSKRPGAHELVWAGAADPVHFSHPVGGHYRRGGRVGNSTTAGRRRAPALPAAESRDFFALVREVWGRLGGLGALPAAASALPSVVIAAGRPSGSSVTTRDRRVHFAQGDVENAIAGKPGGYDYNYSRQALVHELAHTMQNNTVWGSRAQAEGGAAAWARERAPQVFRTGYTNPPLTNYAGFVAAALRRGQGWINRGQFRSFRAGGAIGGAVGAGVRRLQATAGNAGKFQAVLSGLDESLSELTTQRLNGLVATLKRSADKGGAAKIVRSFQAVISVIETELGRRIGSLREQIAKRSGGLEHGQGALDRFLRVQGTDPSSAAGLRAQAQFDPKVVATRRKNVADAAEALKIAQHTHNHAAISEATDELTSAQEELDEAVTKGIEDGRSALAQAALEATEAARAGAQEAAETSQFGVSSAQGSIAGVEVGQRLSRTADTPGAFLEKARAIETQLVPALQGEVGALGTQLNVLRATGASASEIQNVVLSIQTAGNEIGSAMAEVGELLKEAAETAASEDVERAAHRTSLAQLGEQHLELEQRLADTFDTGGQQRSDYVKSQIIPALESDLNALEAQLTVASAEGDSKLAEQIGEAVAQKQNDILQATLEATEDVAANTEQKKLGGSLGFTNGSETLTDAIIGVGNGS